ncbi:unnamed protein product [Prorocentrum cordatum]|uniref:Uncharacterized protein n=1 Tax=Prorocentrum cordatum TaxID=2364126 RepID=A0ABN9SQ07_9DINO|nr:unnamed protein product [Polarella glacialis]
MPPTRPPAVPGSARRRALSREPAAALPAASPTKRRARTLGAGSRPSLIGAPPARRARTLDPRHGLNARLVVHPSAVPARAGTLQDLLDAEPNRQLPGRGGGRGPEAAEDAASASGESSDVEEPKAVSACVRRLESRGKARVRKAMGELDGEQGAAGGSKLAISYLERRSVRKATVETYRQCVLVFCVWAHCSIECLPLPGELDAPLVECMNLEPLKGVKSWRGEKLLAGIVFFHPDHGRLGGLYLPRSLRCLKGWKKLPSSRSRKPLVFAIWAALAVELCRLGAPLLGALVLVMVECYLRSGEMLGLTSGSFLAPSEHAAQNWAVWLFPESGAARSKVGSADDAIPCDSGRCPWTSHIFRALKDRRSSQPLLGLSYPQFLGLFRKAALNIGVNAVPYQGRHSGASLDRATNRLSQEEVQKRGRWAAMTSVKRYEKSGRLNESRECLSDETKAHCVTASRQLEDVLLLGRAAAIPPFAGRASSGLGPSAGS